MGTISVTQNPNNHLKLIDVIKRNVKTHSNVDMIERYAIVSNPTIK